MTRTSCSPPAPAVAATALPREYRKYHSTQTMVTAPSAVTAIWAGVMNSSLAHLCRRGSRLGFDGKLDPHGVERAPDEHERDGQEHGGQDEAQRGAALGGERHRQLDREQSEQRRELDDRIHRDR